MWSFQRAFQVFAGAGTGINESLVAQCLPGSQIVRAPLALDVRRKRTARVRAFIPSEAQPAQVVVHGLHEFRLGPLKIQIFVAKDELAASFARSLMCDPESACVAKVQESCRRRSETAAIAAFSSQHSAFSPRAFLTPQQLSRRGGSRGAE